MNSNLIDTQKFIFGLWNLQLGMYMRSVFLYLQIIIKL